MWGLKTLIEPKNYLSLIISDIIYCEALGLIPRRLRRLVIPDLQTVS
jgi:hypothetical protein